MVCTLRSAFSAADAFMAAIALYPTGARSELAGVLGASWPHPPMTPIMAIANTPQASLFTNCFISLYPLLPAQLNYKYSRTHALPVISPVVNAYITLLLTRI
ncbi:hypothetical protein O3609_06855 [Veillonella atypica]|uniref:hypothetical protein n=1 Tax=Veillonella atypica TaxID=39777 RepID=UPI00352D0112